MILIHHLLSNLKRALAIKFTKMKYKVVGFNPKGMGIPVKNHERFFDYRYLPEEMEFVVDHVKSKYPSRNLYLVGFSLGATF